MKVFPFVSYQLFRDDRFTDFCVHTARLSGNRLLKVGRLEKIGQWDYGIRWFPLFSTLVLPFVFILLYSYMGHCSLIIVEVFTMHRCIALKT